MSKMCSYSHQTNFLSQLYSSFNYAVSIWDWMAQKSKKINGQWVEKQMTANSNGLISDTIIAVGRGEIQTRNLENTSLQCYTYINLTSGVPRGGFGVFKTPEIPKFWQSCIWLQIERKMFSVPIPPS
jgi:hypothetical protein